MTDTLENDAERFRWLARQLYNDGYAWWLCDVCVIESKEEDAHPTIDDVRRVIDKAMKGED